MPVPSLFTALHHPDPAGRAVPDHRHPQHELVLILRGRLHVRSAGTTLPGAPGVMHIFPAGVVHDQGCSGPWHTICLLFHGDDALVADGPQAMDTGGDALLRAWFHQLCELARSRAGEDRAAADAVLAAVLHRLHRLQRDRSEGADRPPALAAALERIAGQLDRDLDVAALAGAVGLSRSHLGELFRRHLGCAPKRHHARLRFERAKDLLSNPYTTVSAVAAELGFADLNWFVRRFRAEHGVPPGRWRTAAGSMV